MWKAVLLLNVVATTFQGCLGASVEYGDLGVFQYGAGTSVCHHAMPEDPSVIGTKFWLYTPNNRYSPQRLHRDDSSSITNSHFSKNRDTKFIIHGWTDVYTNGWAQEMKDALVSENHNVIMVDWQEGAGNVNYAISRADTRVVGRELGSLITALTTSPVGASLSRMHIIGHSLGAQTAGYAGEYKRNTGRITGLDPAGPEFEGCETFCKLDSTDSNYVDVIHTNGGVLGIMEQVGHQDFYPNGGVEQPGCSGPIWEACDHMRAVYLFTDSVSNSCSPYKKCSNYASYPNCSNCGTCPVMGYHALQSRGSGAFYVNTATDAPYC